MKITTFFLKVIRKIFQIINVIFGQLLFKNAAGLLQNLMGNFFSRYARFRFPHYVGAHSNEINDLKYLRKNGYLTITRFQNYSSITELRSKFSEWCMENSMLESQGRLECSSSCSQDIFLNLYPQIESLFDEKLKELIMQYYECEFEIINVHLYRTRKPDDIQLEKTGSAFGGTACWHSDGSLTDTLKVFFLLSDVDENDGPMQLLDKQKSEKVFKKYIPYRSFKHGEPSSKDFVTGTVSYVGETGTCLIVDTNRCLHRASIPSSKARDMLTYYIGVKIKADTHPFSNIARSGEGLFGRLS